MRPNFEGRKRQPIRSILRVAEWISPAMLASSRRMHEARRDILRKLSLRLAKENYSRP